MKIQEIRERLNNAAQGAYLAEDCATLLARVEELELICDADQARHKVMVKHHRQACEESESLREALRVILAISTDGPPSVEIPNVAREALGQDA